MVVCPPGERPPRVFVIRAHRKCLQCGFVFEPRIALAYAIATTCFGVFCIGVFVRECLAVTGALDTFIDSIVVMFSIYVTIVGVRHLMRRPFGRQVRSDKR